MRTAEGIIETCLPPIPDIGWMYCARNIINDTTHPHQRCFTLLEFQERLVQDHLE